MKKKKTPIKSHISTYYKSYNLENSKEKDQNENTELIQKKNNQKTEKNQKKKQRFKDIIFRKNKKKNIGKKKLIKKSINSSNKQIKSKRYNNNISKSNNSNLSKKRNIEKIKKLSLSPKKNEFVFKGFCLERSLRLNMKKKSLDLPINHNKFYFNDKKILFEKKQDKKNIDLTVIIKKNYLIKNLLDEEDKLEKNEINLNEKEISNKNKKEISNKNENEISNKNEISIKIENEISNKNAEYQKLEKITEVKSNNLQDTIKKDQKKKNKSDEFQNTLKPKENKIEKYPNSNLDNEIINENNILDMSKKNNEKEENKNLKKEELNNSKDKKSLKNSNLKNCIPNYSFKITKSNQIKNNLENPNLTNEPLYSFQNNTNSSLKNSNLKNSDLKNSILNNSNLKNEITNIISENNKNLEEKNLNKKQSKEKISKNVQEKKSLLNLDKKESDSFLNSEMRLTDNNFILKKNNILFPSYEKFTLSINDINTFNEFQTVNFSESDRIVSRIVDNDNFINNYKKNDDISELTDNLIDSEKFLTSKNIKNKKIEKDLKKNTIEFFQNKNKMEKLKKNKQKSFLLERNKNPERFQFRKTTANTTFIGDKNGDQGRDLEFNVDIINVDDIDNQYKESIIVKINNVDVRSRIVSHPQPDSPLLTDNLLGWTYR